MRGVKRGERGLKMTAEEILKSIDNAWTALAQQYNSAPDDYTRRAMNLIAKIISKVKSEFDTENSREAQISIEEWLAWLESED